MGPCFIVAQNTNTLNPPTMNSTIINQDIQIQISDELKKNQKEQSIVIKEEETLLEKKNSVKSKSIIKNPCKSQRSERIVPCFNKIQQKENNQNSSPIKIIKLGEASIIARISEKDNSINNNKKQLDSEWDEHSAEQEPQPKVDDKPQEFVETPNNRIQHEQYDMVGKGFTETDNKLINLSMIADEPIKIRGVRLINKSVYSGESLKGQKHGKGILRWSDGSTYEGFWQNNKSEGHGKLVYSDGQIYEGEWHENKAHGHGIFTYNDGSIYDGEWVDNMREGNGIQKWGNGQKYVGQWSAGKKSGYGQLFFEDGSYFKGQFCENQIHGKGIYYWKNQKTYNGEWEHNKKNGRGVMSWENGDCYDGMFKNDKMNGYGVFNYRDRSSSAGLWENGRKQGMFHQKDPTGKLSQIEWRMGKRVKLVEVNKKNKQKKHKASDESKTNSSFSHAS